ncbi:hypothetical protein Ddc_11195 [Ditylenchus destructor]|nr:hypothetical protein Ddc_11195 [Ditylenchus destructor]
MANEERAVKTEIKQEEGPLNQANAGPSFDLSRVKDEPVSEDMETDKNESSAASSMPLSSIQSTSRGQLQAPPKAEPKKEEELKSEFDSEVAEQPVFRPMQNQNSDGFGADSQNQNAGSRSQTRGLTPSQSQIQSYGSSQGQVSSPSLQPPVFEPDAMIITEGSVIPSTSAQPSAGPSVPVKKRKAALGNMPKDPDDELNFVEPKKHSRKKHPRLDSRALTEEKKIRIRELKAESKTLREIAKIVDCSYGSVQKFLNSNSETGSVENAP